MEGSRHAVGTYVSFSLEESVTRGSARLKVLPGPGPADSAPPLACKRPLCGQEVEQPSGRSRPREFCTDACRIRYQRERDLARTALLEARRVAAQYEVDLPTSLRSDPVRPQTSARSPAGPALSASYQALSLIAQVLESIRTDLDDGVLLTVEAVVSRLVEAKLAGDRLLRSEALVRGT
jgi:hypothetical protein